MKNSSILSPIRAGRPPEVWDLPTDSLREEVKEFILSRLDEALLGVDESYLEFVQRVYIIGSITGRQYDESSDVDVNVLIDIEGMAGQMGVDPEALRYSLKQSFIKSNGTPVPDTSYPVNFFLAVDDTMPPADGIYDLLEDIWIKKPEDNYPDTFDPYDSLSDAMERAETLMERIDKRWGAALRAEKALNTYGGLEHKRSLLRNLKALQRIHENIVSDRHEVFDLGKKNNVPVRDLQLSTPNVVYKACEFNGELDKLVAAGKYLEQEGEMSLSEMYGGDKVALVKRSALFFEGDRVTYNDILYGTIIEVDKSNLEQIYRVRWDEDGFEEWESEEDLQPIDIEDEYAEDESEDEYVEDESEYITGMVVDGLNVREDIPNLDSISASLYEYEILPGIREIPLADIGSAEGYFYAVNDIERCKDLAKRIDRSAEINPLIVVIDDEGPYVLEGGHRFVALSILGKTTLPALVVIDTEKVDESQVSEIDKII